MELSKEEVRLLERWMKSPVQDQECPHTLNGMGGCHITHDLLHGKKTLRRHPLCKKLFPNLARGKGYRDEMGSCPCAIYGLPAVQARVRAALDEHKNKEA